MAESSNLRLPGDFGLPATSQMYVGGSEIEKVIAAQRKTFAPKIANPHRFWASEAYALRSPWYDGLIIRLAKRKRINYMTLDLPHYPQHFYFQWWDEDEEDWKEFTGPSTGVLRVYIDGSTPAVVGTAAAYQAKQHPGHYGAGHWLHYDLDTKPITTRMIKIFGTRVFGSDQGGPQTPNGHPADYSLAVRNFDFGWRVRKKEDVPRTPRDPDILTENESFTQTLDLLGSPVELKLRETRASDLLRASQWKSEPMPVPYAVVNFYVDSRGPEGAPQVIDRFDISPLQSGANLNLYYSDEVPDADFGASDAPIVFPMLRPAGESHPQVGSEGILFPDKIGYLDLINQAVQWDPAEPFWIALEFRPQWGSGDTAPHIIFDTGSLQLAWNDGVFLLNHAQGVLRQIPVEFDRNSRMRAVVAYDGERLNFYMPETGAAVNVSGSMEGMKAEKIRFGAELGDSTAPVVFTGHYRLNAMVIKQEPMTFLADDEEGLLVPEPMRRFMDDPDLYLAKTEYIVDDDGSTDNALVRYLPRFAVRTSPDSVNPHGFVGGPGTIFEDVVWTPVIRDYKLRAGMLQFTPVRAKFFKFEFTDLTPEPFQTFAPVSRKVKTFSQAAARPKTQPQKTTTIQQSATSPGLESNADATMQTVRYADTPAITSPSEDDVLPTEALYATDLQMQNQLDRQGGLYRFDSWQPGSAAPRYPTKSKHHYEEVEITHTKRVAYFVGLSGLKMYRVNYSADDDTEQYIELFDDTANIDPAYLADKIVTGTTNHVTNPSFQNGTTGYALYTAGTATGAALTTVADGVFGDQALAVSATELGATGTDRAGWEQTFTTPDFSAQISYSVYARREAGQADLRLNVEYFTAADAFLGSDSVSFAPGDGWERLSALMLPPLDTASARVRWWLENGDGGAVEYRFDGYQVEELHLTDYCDGDQEECIWSGTPHASTSTREAVDIRPWYWDGDRLVTRSNVETSVTTTSRKFASRRRVRGVQFAAQQSGSTQLVPDPDFTASDLEQFWVPTGDVVAMEHSEEVNTTLGTAVKILRSSGLNTWEELRALRPTWNNMESGSGGTSTTYRMLEGDGSTIGGGGVEQSQAVQVSESGRVWAAARVYADHTLVAPLTLQILSAAGEVLAQQDQIVTAGKVVEWSVGYTVGEAPPPQQTWNDIMQRDPSSTEPTYADLEADRWIDLTDTGVAESRDLKVRVMQQSAGEDTWYVDSLALFEDPILWEFTNDDGKSWWPALGIRNNPRGVLIFPGSDDPTQTDPTGLRWRVTGYRPGLHISALDIRPWYAETVFGIPRREPGVSGGPNVQPTDHYPPIEEDAYFKQWGDPIPQDWYYTFRQLLLLDRQQVPVPEVFRPDTFVNPHSLLVEVDPIVPVPPFADLYTANYPEMYGIPSDQAAGVYVDVYDADNDY